MFDTWRKLRADGILGINARNRAYVMRHNPRHRYPLVDDKLTTKRLALEAGIAVPELYGVVQTEHDLRGLGQLLAVRTEFVIKPAHGSGGSASGAPPILGLGLGAQAAHKRARALTVLSQLAATHCTRFNADSPSHAA